MNSNNTSRLRFNLGFLLEADLGTSHTIELDYPSLQVEDDVTLTPLKGKFQVIRNSQGIYVTGELFSRVDVECAKCLEPVNLPITINLDDLFYYPPASAEPGEFVVGEDGFIDIGPLVRQYSLLEVPMKPFCREDCQGLCIECGQNLNHGDCDCETQSLDPRLAALRELLDS